MNDEKIKDLLMELASNANGTVPFAILVTPTDDGTATQVVSPVGPYRQAALAESICGLIDTFRDELVAMDFSDYENPEIAEKSRDELLVFITATLGVFVTIVNTLKETNAEVVH